MRFLRHRGVLLDGSAIDPGHVARNVRLVPMLIGRRILVDGMRIDRIAAIRTLVLRIGLDHVVIVGIGSGPAEAVDVHTQATRRLGLAVGQIAAPFLAEIPLVAGFSLDLGRIVSIVGRIIDAGRLLGRKRIRWQLGLQDIADTGQEIANDLRSFLAINQMLDLGGECLDIITQ